MITTAGNLPTKYVIHTVGPVWNVGSKNEAKKLKACYWNSLKLAEENEIKSLAFPNISTGIYRYPKDLAAAVAVEAVRQYHSEKNSVESVVFVCFDQENFDLYKAHLENS